jgi:GTP-binding protein HflX
LRGRREPSIEVSARTGEGREARKHKVGEMLPRPPVRIDGVLPVSRGDHVSEAHRAGEVVSETHADDGYHLVADVSDSLAARIREAVTVAP